jgi:hypothetical protein
MNLPIGETVAQTSPPLDTAHLSTHSQAELPRGAPVALTPLQWLNATSTCPSLKKGKGQSLLASAT